MCKSNNKFHSIKNLPQNANPKPNIKPNYKQSQKKQSFDHSKQHFDSIPYEPQLNQLYWEYPQLAQLVQSNMTKFNQRLDYAFPLRHQYSKIYDEQSLHSNNTLTRTEKFDIQSQTPTLVDNQFPKWSHTLIQLPHVQYVRAPKQIYKVQQLIELNYQFQSESDQNIAEEESTSDTFQEKTE